MKKIFLMIVLICTLLTLVSCSLGKSGQKEKVATLKSYGFTESFDPEKAPNGTVDSYQTTDTLYFVVIAKNFPEGSKIHEVWEYVTDGSTIEGDLDITKDISNNYLGFNLTPNGSFPAGDYKVYLTWTVNGVDGKLESLAIHLNE